MARNHAIEQYAGAGVLGASLAFNVSDATRRQEVRIDDNGLTLFNADGKRMVRALWASSAVNGVELVPAATGQNVIVRPTSGDDSNVGIVIRPLGSANGFLQTGGGTSQFRWSGSGIGFYGGSPVGKQSITGALSAVTDTNAKDVLTSILSALSASSLVTNSTT